MLFCISTTGQLSCVTEEANWRRWFTKLSLRSYVTPNSLRETDGNCSAIISNHRMMRTQGSRAAEDETEHEFQQYSASCPAACTWWTLRRSWKRASTLPVERSGFQWRGRSTTSRGSHFREVTHVTGKEDKGREPRALPWVTPDIKWVTKLI